MLTDGDVKALKSKEKPYKKFDDKGLFVLVYPDRVDPETGEVIRRGAKGFRFRYRFGGREKMISFGNYPKVSLKEARRQRDEARQQIEDCIDPSAVRQSEKQAQAETFKALAEEWLAAGCPGGRKGVNEDTKEQLRKRLKRYVYPKIGNWPINDVTAPELLKLLRAIESKGKRETAHRVRSLCSRVFRYGIVTGRADRDPAADLIGALTATDTRHFPGITDPRRIGELLRAIDHYEGQPSTIFALKISPHVFVRPCELRWAEWSEFSDDTWRIPFSRMKMDRHHVVPLSRQVQELLDELRSITGHSKFLFPGVSTTRPISNNTVNQALRRMDFGQEEMCGHGFRTTASTRLNEMGYAPDVIELQLAHKEQNNTRDAYNRAERLDDRRNMMQSWSDYLDGLKADKSATVLTIGGAA